MKTLFTILCLLITSAAQAQDWTKYCVLYTGDTVRLGDKITINRDKSLTDIFPHPNSPAELKDRYKIYLASDVPGQTFTITRISRIKKSKGGYTPTVNFEYYNERMNRFNSAMYCVMLDNAVRTGQVTLTLSTSQSTSK